MMFKLSIALSMMMATATQAFVVHVTKPSAIRPTFGVMNAAVDTTADMVNAIENAINTANEFGADSAEARLAWENVEELGEYNSDATRGSLANECVLTDEQVSKACVEYGEKLDSLKVLMKEYSPKMANLKTLASDLQSIKLNVATSKPGADSPALRDALASAKNIEKEFGKGSPESKVAWAEVEEIASAGLTNAMGSKLDDECLVETALEACQQLEELNRALNLEKIESDEGLSNF